MRIAISEAQTDEIGREIGFDMYRFNIPIVEMEKYPAVQEGYRHAQSLEVSKVTRATIFERKLISIKMRAYRKGIEVGISEDDLDSAFHDCKGICPVTGREMTVAKVADTDWSVDRLDNDKGYLPDNIVIMSKRANEAKDSLSLQELIMYCMGLEVPPASKAKFIKQSRTFWRNLVDAYRKKMPSYLFGKVMEELCREPGQRLAVLTSLNMHLLQLVSDSNLREVERLWGKCPFLSVYLRDGTIHKSEIAKLRKSALNAVKAASHSEKVSEIDMVFRMTALFIKAERSKEIISKLTERWSVDIDSDETRRIIMLAALMDESLAR